MWPFLSGADPSHSADAVGLILAHRRTTSPGAAVVGADEGQEPTAGDTGPVLANGGKLRSITDARLPTWYVVRTPITARKIPVSTVGYSTSRIPGAALAL
jgi:hypothetical protein